MGILDSIFGGGGGDPTTRSVTQTQADPRFGGLFNQAQTSLQGFLANPPQLGPVPGFTPLQEEGRGAIATAARPGGQLAGFGGAVGTAGTDLLDPVSTIRSNPALQEVLQLGNRRLLEDFQQSVLPSIAGEAVGAGGVGGSRQGVAQGLATQALGRTLSDLDAQVLNNAFNQALQAQVQTIGLTPQVQQAIQQPGIALEALGAQERDLEVEQQQRDFVNQFLPFLATQSALGTAGQIPGATRGISEVTTTGTTPTEPNVVAKGLGGALAGAGTGALVGAEIGAIGGPMGAGIGAAVGALAAIL